MPKKFMETEYDSSRTLRYLSLQINGRATPKKKEKSHFLSGPDPLILTGWTLSWLNRSNNKGSENRTALKAEANPK